MVPGLDVESLNKLGKLIAGLERFHLENTVPQELDPSDMLDEEQAFFCIEGVSDFWNRQPGVDFWQYIVDLVIGAHNQRLTDLTMVMLGTPRKLSIFLSLGDEKATQTLLEGIFPGILLTPISAQKLAPLLRSHCGSLGVMTGIPSRKAFDAAASQEEKNQQAQQQTHRSPARQNAAQLERVIRGMYGATWAYMVQAHPRPRHKVVEERMKIIDLLTQVTTRSRMQLQSTKQESMQVTTIESGSQTQSYSSDVVNYRAQYLIRLLERELERLNEAAAAGQWTTHVYFGADCTDDAQRLSSLLLGTLAGTESRPEPMRAMLCQPRGAPIEAFHTYLTSQEVATLMQLPREEVPGYAVHDHVLFDVDFRSPDSMNLPLGFIQQNGRDTRDTFNISLDALTRHAVVVGVTGSGKTTTVMNLLDRVVEARKPFLVIEPAKTEYRSLYHALTPRTSLRVYTLGNELVAPFRLNPFEFETTDEPGSASLLTHIDFLKAVFNAAFALYTPMPHVLEEALHEVYEDKGWDLTSGTNRRLPNWEERHDYPIFPTLTDLYSKVEEVTNRLGYDSEVESNVKAGLKARVGSLRIGSKGLMLDTARGTSMQELLSRPTILELENIGSDDEKTFLMGLLLARLYEYRRLQASSGALSGDFQHLLVFEEAHRLLLNTPTQVDSESSNMRAQAIEVFTNMLSEVRAYGQGVLVAEQIPSKLAPDVLKNTNLKIVHRMIAQDDRLSVGQTMNLNEGQQTHLGILDPGMAAVYAEGADHAYLVRMENYKRKVAPLADKILKQMSHDYASVAPFQAILNIIEYDIPRSFFGGPDTATYQMAGKLLDSSGVRWLWANLLLRIAANPLTVVRLFGRLSEHIETEMSFLPSEQHDALMRMIIVRGCAEMMHARGAQFGWSYAQVEDMRLLLTQGLLALAFSYQLIRNQEEADPLPPEIDAAHQEALQSAGEYSGRFIEAYERLLERKQGPFIGCQYCLAKCLYRAEVSALLSARERAWIDDELADTSYETTDERYAAIAQEVTSMTLNWLGRDPDDEPDLSIASISYCAAMHAIAKTELNEYEQELASKGLSNHLLNVQTEEEN